MGKSSSLDLRVRISGEVERGQSCRAAARRFGVAPSTAVRLAQRKAATKMLDDEQPAHSFATLMAQMATLVRNTCRTPSAAVDAPTFELLTTASAHQQRALALIQAIQL